MEEVFNRDSEDKKDLIEGYVGNGILAEKQSNQPGEFQNASSI